MQEFVREIKTAILKIISPLKYAFNPCPSGSSQALAKNGAQ